MVTSHRRKLPCSEKSWVSCSGFLSKRDPGVWAQGLGSHSPSVDCLLFTHAPTHSFIILFIQHRCVGQLPPTRVAVTHNHRPTASFRLRVKTDLGGCPRAAEEPRITTDPSEDERDCPPEDPWSQHSGWNTGGVRTTLPTEGINE